jgi:hypothetical protein
MVGRPEPAHVRPVQLAQGPKILGAQNFGTCLYTCIAGEKVCRTDRYLPWTVASLTEDQAVFPTPLSIDLWNPCLLWRGDASIDRSIYGVATRKIHALWFRRPIYNETTRRAAATDRCFIRFLFVFPSVRLVPAAKRQDLGQLLQRDR